MTIWSPSLMIINIYFFFKNAFKTNSFIVKSNLGLSDKPKAVANLNIIGQNLDLSFKLNIYFSINTFCLAYIDLGES